MMKFKQQLTALCITLALPTAWVAAETANVWHPANTFVGMVKTNTDEPKNVGVFEFSNSGASIAVAGTENIKANTALWADGNVVYGLNCVYDMSFGMGGQVQTTILTTLTGYDPQTWEVISTNDFDKRKIFYCTCAAFNHADGKIYGCFYNPASEEYEFAVVDPAAKEKTPIGPELEFYWTAAFFDDAQNLWCIDEYGWLYKVDLETGELDEIGDTGFEPSYDGCAAYDSRSGKAYWSMASSKQASVIEVDLATAEGTRLFDIDGGNRVMGFYFPNQPSAAGAPDYATDINLALQTGELGGTLSFTMPTNDATGAALPATLKYRLIDNGVTVAEAEANSGEQVQIDVTFSTEGLHKLSLLVLNGETEGRIAEDIVFVGNDTPLAPANVKATWEKGLTTLKWEGVNSTVNHGSVDPDAVTYTVVRYPDETTVATDLNATEFTETFYPTETGEYYYAVSAHLAGKTSEAGISNKLSLKGMKPIDLAVSQVTAPSRVEPGQEFAIEATVINEGINNINGATIALYRDGELILTESVPELEFNQTHNASFRQTLTVLDGQECVYSVKAEIEGDDNEDNNVSAEIKISNHLSPAPTVSNLAATPGTEITISWDAPDLEAADVKSEVTDDFESYDSWAMGDTLGDWAMDDRDGNYLCPDVMFPFGEIDEDTQMAYCVIDNTHEDLDGDPDFDSHSGNKFLASMCSDQGPNDDWLVSPELPQGSQTISFFAKSRISGYAAETFEVQYSSDGRKFKRLERFEKISNVWTEFMVTLPDDAKYFAIRCVSDYCDMFFLDDITYTRFGGDYTLTGYNVYRDGEKLNEAPVEATTYVDAEATPGEHMYSVTAVYDNCESRPQSVSALLSGVESVNSAKALVAASHRSISIRNAANLEVLVSTIDGKVVFNGTGKNEMLLNVDKGVYIVRVGDKVSKIVVND